MADSRCACALCLCSPMPSEAFIRGHVSGHVIYSILVLRPKINTPFIFSVLCTFSGMKTGKYDFIRILRRALPCPGTHSSSEERPRLRHFFIVFPPEIIYNVGTQSVPRYIPSFGDMPYHYAETGENMLRGPQDAYAGGTSWPQLKRLQLWQGCPGEPLTGC